MHNKKFDIQNSSGFQLQAHLELPDNETPEHYVIFAHCFTCNSDLKPVKNISRALTAHGFGVVRFDFTGLGESEGEFADSHFSANVEDLMAVSAYMTKHYKSPSLMVGHSLGGAAVIVAASRLESVKAVATIGTPATITHVKKHFSHSEEEIPEKGAVEINIGGRPFKINQEFVSDFDKIDLPEITKSLRKPIVIMHSPLDKIVGIDNAHDLYQNAHHPKSFISLNDADHLLLKEEDSRYVGNMVGAWVQAYI